MPEYGAYYRRSRAAIKMPYDESQCRRWVKLVVLLCAGDFRSTPISGQFQSRSGLRKSANNGSRSFDRDRACGARIGVAYHARMPRLSSPSATRSSTLGV